MPLPKFLLSITALVCERVLLEADGVASAIRVVYVFYISPPPSLAPDTLQIIQAYALVILKSVPGYAGEHALRVRLINTVGESSTIAEDSHAEFAAKPGFEELPHSINVVVQLNIGVKRFGICYICLDIDGEEVARTPLTLLQKHPETRVS